jgi:Histidine kinase-, DNA gyrase B-, and HSP90-like ATPase
MVSSIIQVQNFIVATRDSGYKSTAAALAEIVDNAIESGATKVHIQIHRNRGQSDDEYELTITDNGSGMKEAELSLALQFGGSTRFNSRSQLGRYGMGLPNSSLSQCKRVEVMTWKNKEEVFSNYLDVEEVVAKNTNLLNPVVREKSVHPGTKSGTVVTWKKCDRLSYRYLKSLIKHIHFELGRVFRYAIWRGVEVKIDSEKVIPFDPLFIGNGINLIGGVEYGQELLYKVKVPGTNRLSPVRVRFIELPVAEWATLPNEEKKKRLIIKNAGVSILRAEREVDYGWFFMGEKRKENYDDWWRCEISFHPELDEVFGVTHTKQEIKETEYMSSILVPDLEQTARALNNRVRLSFIELKKNQPSTFTKTQLERTDVYQPAIKNVKKLTGSRDPYNLAKGMHYKIVAKELADDIFFDVAQDQNNVVLTINTTHLFYEKVFKALHDKKITTATEFIKIMEFVMFAAGRSELTLTNTKNKIVINDFKKEWSSQLKTFIS